MIILASASPRRKEILEGLGVDFRIVVADVDESSDERDPQKLTEELALRKGLAVWQKLANDNADLDDCVIISADTVVWCDGEIFGKPHDKADAERMIRAISGGEHKVVSGVAVVRGGVAKSASCVTTVRVDSLSDDELMRYIDSGEPMDKAGSYAIQGKFSLWINGIDGCYFNVVGLPVHCLNGLHRELFGENLL
jgi:septum formation protein